MTTYYLSLSFSVKTDEPENLSDGSDNPLWRKIVLVEVKKRLAEEKKGDEAFAIEVFEEADDDELLEEGEEEPLE